MLLADVSSSTWDGMGWDGWMDAKGHGEERAEVQRPTPGSPLACAHTSSKPFFPEPGTAAGPSAPDRGKQRKLGPGTNFRAQRTCGAVNESSCFADLLPAAPRPDLTSCLLRFLPSRERFPLSQLCSQGIFSCSSLCTCRCNVCVWHCFGPRSSSGDMRGPAPYAARAESSGGSCRAIPGPLAACNAWLSPGFIAGFAVSDFPAVSSGFSSPRKGLG